MKEITEIIKQLAQEVYMIKIKMNRDQKGMTKEGHEGWIRDCDTKLKKINEKLDSIAY